METSSHATGQDLARMARLLERYLKLQDGAAYRVNQCRMTNTRRRDGTRGSIEYELLMEDPSSGDVWSQRVTGITYGGERTRRVWGAMTASGEARVATSAPYPMPAFAYVPEVDMLVQVFPHDHRLPALAQFVTGPPADIVPSLLAEFGPGNWSLSDWSTDVVRYRVGMRAIVALDVRGAESTTGAVAERLFFAKIYRDEEQARQAFQLQADLHRLVAALNCSLRLPKPLAGGLGLRTVVTTAVSGDSLEKRIRRGEDVISAVQAAARAVAVLHSLADGAPARPIADDVNRLEEARAMLSAARPDLASAISEMVEAVVAGLANAPTAVIHGDLKPEHILLDGERVSLIDFDLAATADPVIDVAHVLAYLGRSEDRARARSHVPVDAAQAFVTEYFAHVPDAWRSRLPVYHAMTSIHKAVGLSRKRVPGDTDQIGDVIREGQMLLAHAGEELAVPTFKRRLTRPNAPSGRSEAGF